MYNYNRGVNIYQVSQDEYNGDLKITFIPRGGKSFNATSDVNILEQIRKKMDEELIKKQVIIQKSEIKMTTTGNIEYTANYKHRPKQFGIAIAISNGLIAVLVFGISPSSLVEPSREPSGSFRSISFCSLPPPRTLPERSFSCVISFIVSFWI